MRSTKRSFVFFTVASILIIVLWVGIVIVQRNARESTRNSLLKRVVQLYPQVDQLTGRERSATLPIDIVLRNLGCPKYKLYESVKVSDHKGHDRLGERLTGISEFDEVTTLSIYKMPNLLRVELEELSRLRNVERLYLYDCPSITSSDLAFLANCLPKLRQLKLKGLPRIDSSKQIPKSILDRCQVVEIDGIDIRAVELKDLMRSKVLQRLTLSNLVIDISEVTGHESANPQLEAVSLRKVKHANTVLKLLSTSDTLRDLSIVGCNIGTDELTAISQLNEVVILEISECAVNDEVFKYVCMLTNLRRLSLNDTQVTGVGIDSLAALPQLRELNLVGTEFTDDGFSNLRAINSLSFLSTPENFTDVLRVKLKSELNKSLYLKMPGYSGWLVPKEIAAPPGANQ